MLQVPAVKAYLEQHKLAGAVYMVTGVKVAKGLSFEGSQVRAVGVGGAVTVDATALGGVPVSGGPKGEVQRKVEIKEAYGASSDFVFAYRVQRVYINWLWGSVKSKEKVGGELSGIGGNDEDWEEEEEEDVVEPEGIGAVSLERDVGAEDVPNGFVKSQDEIDGEEGEEFLYVNSMV